jgi:hypothetical protein
MEVKPLRWKNKSKQVSTKNAMTFLPQGMIVSSIDPHQRKSGSGYFKGTLAQDFRTLVLLPIYLDYHPKIRRDISDKKNLIWISH